jgi:hypothetical protein
MNYVDGAKLHYAIMPANYFGVRGFTRLAPQGGPVKASLGSVSPGTGWFDDGLERFRPDSSITAVR